MFTNDQKTENLIRERIEAHEKRIAAEKREKEIDALLSGMYPGALLIETPNVVYTSEERTRTGIDTKRVYADFPDFKSAYGTTTRFVQHAAREKTEAEKQAGRRTA